MVDFGGPVAFDHLVLEEDLADGQRIDGYRIVAEPDGREVARGTTIGSQSFVVVNEDSDLAVASRLAPQAGGCGP